MFECCGAGGGVGGLVVEEVDVNCCCLFADSVSGRCFFDLSRPARFLSSSICARCPSLMVLIISSSESLPECVRERGVVVGVDTVDL